MINKVVAINQLHYYLSVGYAAIVEWYYENQTVPDVPLVASLFLFLTAYAISARS